MMIKNVQTIIHELHQWLMMNKNGKSHDIANLFISDELFIFNFILSSSRQALALINELV